MMEELDALRAQRKAIENRQRIKDVAAIFEAVAAHIQEGGTYRYLIYDRLGFDQDAYHPLYKAGGALIALVYCELAEARDKADRMKARLKEQAKLKAALESENAQLRAALEFYANKDNWDSSVTYTKHCHLPINVRPITDNDRGATARKALEVEHD